MTIGSAKDWRLVAEAFERERDAAKAEVERLREALKDLLYWTENMDFENERGEAIRERAIAAVRVDDNSAR